MSPKKPVVILHGYSDESESFEPLARFLNDNGFETVNLWLADYMSEYDEITIHDLGQAMGRALIDKAIPQLPKSFDLIAHSTGGLVVRSYLSHYFYGHPDRCPIDHLLLLAPANFGSPLAALGKSMVGRLFKGWNWDHLFQTGTRILQALELASPISWEMALTDLFNPNNQLFRVNNIYTTILIGSEPYEGLKGIAHENGSDGTVRVSTANLNARYCQIFYEGRDQFVVKEFPRQYDPIAFGVLYGFNHGTIVNPTIEREVASPLGQLILNSLLIDSPVAYESHRLLLEKLTQETFIKGQRGDKKKCYHEYQNLAVKVHDQYGETIPDYFLEFFQEKNDENDLVLKMVQKEILEKVKCYSADPGYRSLLLDTTDMNSMLLDKGHEVDFSIEAAAKSRRVFYRNPDNEYVLYANSKNKPLLTTNATLLFDIGLHRDQNPEVFKLKQYSKT